MILWSTMIKDRINNEEQGMLISAYNSTLALLNPTFTSSNELVNEISTVLVEAAEDLRAAMSKLLNDHPIEASQGRLCITGERHRDAIKLLNGINANKYSKLFKHDVEEVISLASSRIGDREKIIWCNEKLGHSVLNLIEAQLFEILEFSADPDLMDQLAKARVLRSAMLFNIDEIAKQVIQQALDKQQSIPSPEQNKLETVEER